MYKNTKRMALIGASMLLCIGTPAYASESTLGESGSQEEQQENREWWKDVDNYGYVELPSEIHSIKEGADDITINQYANLPESYDSREKGTVSGIRNQNPWGTCWSFASMGALEASLLSQGYYEDIDLSEYHLINFNIQSAVDPLGGTEGDSITYRGTLKEFLESGSNVVVAFHALANWNGAVDEATAEYPKSNPVALENTQENAYLQDIVHLQQLYKISGEDTDAIKKEIMNYGGVTTSIYYNDYYLNDQTDAYYIKDEMTANHAVLLVGWDDNFSKDNFNTAPSQDGAWLVKNSWGTWFGDQGYFWVSYEDASLSDTMCVLVGEPADNYDNNYQYDGTYMDTYIGVKSAANVFWVKDGEYKESLEAVSFQIRSTNKKYSIQIYTDLTNLADPTSGIARLDSPITGNTVYEGYYTVKLPEPVKLNPGQSFSVVIQFEGQGSVLFAAERSTTWNNTVYTATAKQGQSLADYQGQGNWSDFGQRNNCNLRIKAFTTNTSEEKDSISLKEEEMELTVGEEKQLSILYNGVEQPQTQNASYIWTITEGDAAEVTEDGTVIGKKQGSCTVTCTSAVNADLEASAKITIKTAFEDIRTDEWQYPFVVKMYDMGIMTGKKENLFGTNDKLSRAEFVTMLYAYAGKPACTYNNTFSDVKETDWFALPVSWAYEQGITTGYGDRFGSTDTITREQLVLMLYKYAVATDKAGEYVPGTVEEYPDKAQISNYAYKAMDWAVYNKMISGRGENLAPKGTTTRAECAAIMAGFVER